MSHARRSASAAAAKFGALGLGALALGCAAMAAFFVGNLLTAKGYTGDRVLPVVVAKANLPAAQPLSADDLVVIDWPEKNVPVGSFARIDDVFAKDERPVPAVGILEGEPVVASRLSTTKAGTGIARLVRPNMRAVALQVDDSIGYTGLVYPGAFVDVIVTIRDPEGRGPSSRIAVQHAKVLTVGADTDVATRRPAARDEKGKLSSSQDRRGTFVTLEVTPEEAEIVSIARNEGKLDIALRNGRDERQIDTKGATPVMFSAFAVAEEEEEEAERGERSSSRSRFKARAKVKTSRRRARTASRRTIDIVATDDPDVAPTRNDRIETHYAN